MSPPPLVPDANLVARCQRIIGEYTADRVQIIVDRPGNPMSAKILRHGSALATRVPQFGEHMFNRAFGYTDASLESAVEVLDLYDEAKVAGAFEIAPGLANAKLLELLHERGYRHTHFHGAFAGPADLTNKPSPGVVARLVETQDELAAFSDVYHLGWNISAFKVPMAPWLRAPGWRLYLGLCDGMPAGAAVLYLKDGDAYLADSAVAPAFRRRGIHRALLDARCDAARSLGAAVVFSGADYAGPSCRNMVRKGLAVLYTKAIWTRSGR